MNNVTDYAQDGLSLANICPMCIEQEQLCVDCVDAADARLTDKAYELVDDAYDMYRYAPMYTPLLKLSGDPSGHDWTSSQTYERKQGWIVKMTEIWDDNCHLVELSVTFLETDEPLVRNEYLPPIVQLQDGGEYEELWELDDQRQFTREYVCQACHILTPIHINTCQVCDAVLEPIILRYKQNIARLKALLAKQNK